MRPQLQQVSRFTAGVQSDVFGRSSVPPVVDETLRSSGQQLDPAVQTLMSSRFGHDFSRVRIHADSKAARSADAVNAEAYTVGRDIVFNAGRYQPATSCGQHLLAHELTHVLQQSSHDGAHASDLKLTGRDHSSELEARSVADRIMSGSAPEGSPVRATPSQGFLQRSDKDGRVGDVLAKIVYYFQLMTRYEEMRASGALSEDQIAEIDAAIEEAQNMAREAERVVGKGSDLYEAADTCVSASGLLLVDDLSGAGMSNDVLIPLALLAVGVLAVAGWARSSSPSEIAETCEAASRTLSRVVRLLERAVPDRADAEPAPRVVPTPNPPGEVIPIGSHRYYRWHGPQPVQPQTPTRLGPSTAPVPNPQPQPRRREGGPIEIIWPKAVWHNGPGIGDPGQRDTTHNLPDQDHLFKMSSTYYESSRPEVKRYRTKITNPPFRLTIPERHDIHHKWPLFLGGPGNADRADGEYTPEGDILTSPNLVVMSQSDHTHWHWYLSQQPDGPNRGRGPSEFTPDGTEFIVVGQKK